MSRDAIYYRDWQESNGWRYRLEILPANTYTPQAGTPVSLPAATIPPEWGSAPSGGSIYLQLGDNAVLQTTVTTSEYDGLPLGLPIPPTMTVGLDLSSLNESGFSALVGYLLDPVMADAASNLYAGTVYSYQSYDLSTLFTLLTDKGAGVGIADFKVEFMGVQQSPIPTTVTVRKQEDKVTMDVECIHIARAAMESVPISVVAARCLSDHTSGGRPNNGDDSAVVLYDYLYDNGSRTWGRAHCRYKSEIVDGNRAAAYEDKCRLFYLQQLQSSCQALLEDVFRGFQRLHPTSTATAGFYSNNTEDPSYSPSYKFSTPLDTLLFFKQDYSTANGIGDSLKCGDNSDSNMGSLILFVGLIWKSTDTAPTTPSAAESVCTGGFFIDKHEDSIYAYPTLYDFQTHWAAGSFCKGQYALHDRDTLKIYYNVVYSRLSTAHYQLQYDDIVKGSDGAPEATIEIGGESLSGVTVAMPVTGGEDLSEYTYKLYGVKVDNDRSLEVLFNTTPSVGDAANRYQMSKNGTEANYNPDSFDHPIVMGASSGFPLRTLYYLDTPSFMNTEVPIRVYDRIGTHLPPTSFLDLGGEGVSLPAPTDNETTIRGDFDGFFWTPMRDHIKRAQKLSGLPRFIAESWGFTFGSRKQVRYEVTLPLEFSCQSDLGDLYEFVNASNTYIGGNIFLRNSSFLGGLVGKPIVCATTPDYAAGTSTVVLLASSFS